MLTIWMVLLAVWVILAPISAFLLYVGGFYGGSNDFHVDKGNGILHNIVNLAICLFGYSFFFVLLAMIFATATVLFPFTITAIYRTKQNELKENIQKENDVKRFEEWKNLSR